MNELAPTVPRPPRSGARQLALFGELPSERAARLAEAELERQQERAFYCLDCDADTNAIDEYYALHDSVWLQANPSIAGMLCIACLELRLGRPLTPADFAPNDINHDPQLLPQHAPPRSTRRGHLTV